MEIQDVSNLKAKHFFTISETKEFARVTADEKKKSRPIIKKLLGSNMTALDFAFESKEHLGKLPTDPIRKATKLCDILYGAYCAEYLKTFKEKEFQSLIEDATKIYIEHCRSYSTDEIKKFPDFNVSETRDALEVLDSCGDSNATKNLSIVHQYETNLGRLTRIEESLVALQRRFDPDIMRRIAEDFLFAQQTFGRHRILSKVISPIEIKINDCYNCHIEHIESKITDAKSKVRTTVNDLLILFSQYNKIEQAYGEISQHYKTRKYDDELENLQDSLEKLRQDHKQIQGSWDEVKEIGDLSVYDHLKISIENILKNIVYQYREFTTEKKALETLDSEIETALKREIEKLISAFIKDAKTNSKLTLEEQVNIWWDVIRRLDMFANGHSSIATLDYEVDKQKKNLQEKILSLLEKSCRHFQKSKGVDRHLELLRFCCDQVEHLGTIEIFQQRKAELTCTELETGEFIRECSQTSILLDEIEYLIEKDNASRVVQSDHQIASFVAKYAKRDVLDYSDLQDGYYSVKERYRALAAIIMTYLNKYIVHGQVELFHPGSKNHYVFLSDPVFRIGRLDEGISIIKSGRMEIPWRSVSSNHLEVEFRRGIINDLNSSNGTFTPKSPMQSIKTCDLDETTEFSIAKSITFQVQHTPGRMTHIVFDKITHPKDITNKDFDKAHLQGILSRIHIIFVHENVPVHIEKQSGVLLDSSKPNKGVFEIRRREDTWLYSDVESEIDNNRLLSVDDPDFGLQVL